MANGLADRLSSSQAISDIEAYNQGLKEKALADRLANDELKAQYIGAFKPKVDISQPLAFFSGWTGNKAPLEAYKPPQEDITQRLMMADKLYPDQEMGLEKQEMDILRTKLDAALKQEEMSQKKKVEGMNPLDQLKLEEALFKKQEREMKKTPEGKIQGLSTSDRDRFDKVVMGLSALRQVEDVYKDENRVLGVDLNKISPIGDNPYTFARSQFEEAIGRMQSGGAIGDKEGERFRKLIPTPTDSRQIADKKVKEMRDLLEQRFTSFGVKKEDSEKLGIDPNYLGFNRQQMPEKKPGAVSRTDAIATPMLSPEKTKRLEELRKKYGK